MMSTETPPLARGRLADLEIAADERGNTPACAGKTEVPYSKKTAFLETPPLARGRRVFWAYDPQKNGNTPACAGKTNRAAPSFLVWLETPPLARGRLRKDLLDRPSHGNTPACAGKTIQFPLRIVFTWKHPRLRGEDFSLLPIRKRKLETPPLARGRPAASSRAAITPETPPLARGRQTEKASGRSSVRNTPACAGKTATFCTKTSLAIQNTLLLTDLRVFH